MYVTSPLASTHTFSEVLICVLLRRNVLLGNWFCHHQKMWRGAFLSNPCAQRSSCPPLSQNIVHYTLETSTNTPPESIPRKCHNLPECGVPLLDSSWRFLFCFFVFSICHSLPTLAFSPSVSSGVQIIRFLCFHTHLLWFFLFSPMAMVCKSPFNVVRNCSSSCSPLSYSVSFFHT